jgi:hypothetical protein
MLIRYLILQKGSALNPSYSKASSQFACLHVWVSSLGFNSQFYGHSGTTHKISPLLLHATSFKFYLPLDVHRKSVHASYKSEALHNFISPFQVVMPIQTSGKCTVVDSREHPWPRHEWLERSQILIFLWYDQPRGVVVRVSDYWSWGPEFDSRFCHGNFSLKGKILLATMVWVV